MALIITSSKFTPLERVPQIGIHKSLLDIISLLDEREAGGFVLFNEQNEPLCYIRADNMAWVMLALAESEGWPKIEQKGITGLVDNPASFLYKLSIAGKIDAQAHIETTEVNHGVHPVEYEKEQVGWFFPEELWARTIYTTPPVYRCQRDHDNLDPDRGRCSQPGCTARITSVITK